MNSRTCKNIYHNNSPISFLCLNPNCSKNRLICQVCAIQNHQKHQYDIVQINLQSIKKIHLNFVKCEFKDSLKNDIDSSLAKLYENRANCLKQLQSSITQWKNNYERQLQHLKIIRSYFQDNYPQQIVKVLQSNENIDGKIQDIVKGLKNLKENQITTSSNIEETCQKVRQQCKKKIEEIKQIVIPAFMKILVKREQIKLSLLDETDIKIQIQSHQNFKTELQINDQELKKFIAFAELAQKPLKNSSVEQCYSIQDWLKMGKKIDEIQYCDIEFKQELVKIPAQIHLMSHIKELDLSSNQIKKIQHLNTLTNLLKLRLYDNLIEKIENLENLSKLQQLNLSCNKIAKIQNLQGLHQLKHLRLSTNLIIVIQNLQNLPKLNKLWIGNNPTTLTQSQIQLLNALTLKEVQIYMQSNYVPYKLKK